MTTTLSMLATLLPPTSGQALINGFDVIKHPTQVRRCIGFVFQDPSSDDLLTGRENLYLHALMYGVKDSEINKKIDEGLKLVDLTDKVNPHLLAMHISEGILPVGWAGFWFLVALPPLAWGLRTINCRRAADPAWLPMVAQAWRVKP